MSRWGLPDPSKLDVARARFRRGFIHNRGALRAFWHNSQKRGCEPWWMGYKKRCRRDGKEKSRKNDVLRTSFDNFLRDQKSFSPLRFFCPPASPPARTRPFCRCWKPNRNHAPANMERRRFWFDRRSPGDAESPVNKIEQARLRGNPQSSRNYLKYENTPALAFRAYPALRTLEISGIDACRHWWIAAGRFTSMFKVGRSMFGVHFSFPASYPVLLILSADLTMASCPEHATARLRPA